MSQFPRPLKAVLFDLDGVIINSIDNHVVAWERMFQSEGLTINPRDVKLREGEKAEVTFRNIAQQYGFPYDEQSVDLLVEKKRGIYRSLPGVHIYPGFLKLHQQLRSFGISTTMITGSSIKNLFVALTGDDLELFDLVLTAEDYTHGKPDPEPYRKGVEWLSLNPEEVLVVENAPLGIRSARAAGLFTVALCTTLEPADLNEASLVVADHRALQKLITQEVLP